MALAFADRVRETTTTTGTGTVTLAGAVTGYQSFSAIGNGNTTYYTINAGSQWEVGIGTYTASGTTLSRDTVLSSSNAGSLVDFSAGTKDVFVGYPAGKVVIQDASGNVGIGTLSPTEKLVLNSAGNVQVATKYINGNTTGVTIGAGADGSAFVYQAAAQPFIVYTNATERMRIDSSGNVGIGTGSVSSVFGTTLRVYSAGSGGTLQLGGATVNSYLFTSEGAAFSALGNSSNHPFTFFTNDTERMRITNTGNVGIGTSSPGTKLHVAGGGNIRLTATSDGSNGVLQIYNSTEATLLQSYCDTNNGYIAVVQAKPLILATTNTERMRIDASGNVGIGTTSITAGYKLDISGSANASGSFVSGGGTTNQTLVGNKTLLFYNTSVSEGVIRSADDTSTFTSVGISKDVVRFATQNSERMRIDGSGNVGIGTTTPQNKLVVSDGGAGGLEFLTNGVIQSYNRSGAAYQPIYLDAQSILFRPSGSEAARIDASGNVLINRSSTSGLGKLNVDGGADFTGGNVLLCRDTGNVGIGTSSPGAKLAVDTVGTSGVGLIVQASSLTASQINMGIGVITAGYPFIGTNTSTNPLQFGVRDATDVIFVTSATEKMRLTSGGNVGIGTSSPTSISNYKAITLDATTGTFIDFRENGTNRLRIGGDGGTAFINGASGTLRLLTSDVERARIDSSGNLLVGTITAQGKLSVNSATGNVGFNTGTSSSPERGNLWYDTDGTGWKFNIGKRQSGSFTAQMTFQDNGNVGIGTTSPSVQLQINGSQPQIQWSNPTTGATSNDGTHLYLSSSDFWLVNKEAAAMVFATNNTEQVRITSAGNVGIGTSSPGTKLEVNGSIAFGTSLTSGVGVTTQDCSFELGGNRGGDGNAYIDLHATSGTDYEMRILRGGGANGALDIVNNGTGVFTLNATGATVMRFATSNTEQMRIDSAGNVGIGTSTTTGAKFTVAGGNGILVNGNGASGYNVTQFINNGSITMSVGVSGSTAAGWSQNLAHLGTTSNSPLAFGTNSTERARIHASGGVSIGNTVDTGAASLNVSGDAVFQNRVYTEMTAPAVKSASATLTGAEVMQGYLQTTGSASPTYTLPTGADLQAAMPASVAALNDISFDFTVIHTGTNVPTLATSTGITAVGSLAITATVGAVTFRIRKTATNTFIIYRT